MTTNTASQIYSEINKALTTWSLGEINLMIALFGPEKARHYYNLSVEDDCSTIFVWHRIAMKLFCEGRHGPGVDAVRRVITAITNHSPYRMTPEFEEICKFDTT